MLASSTTAGQADIPVGIDGLEPLAVQNSVSLLGHSLDFKLVMAPLWRHWRQSTSRTRPAATAHPRALPMNWPAAQEWCESLRSGGPGTCPMSPSDRRDHATSSRRSIPVPAPGSVAVRAVCTARVASRTTSLPRIVMFYSGGRSGPHCLGSTIRRPFLWQDGRTGRCARGERSGSYGGPVEPRQRLCTIAGHDSGPGSFSARRTASPDDLHIDIIGSVR